jgi:hypothetical protein
MLHGTILFPGTADDAFIASLHTIRHVKWASVISTLNRRFLAVPDDQLPAHCNLAIILDPDFTSFGFLAGLVRKGCHLFLPGKQLMTPDERLNLIQLAEEGNTFIQIRNDLLFHPSFLAEEKNSSKSKLIDIRQVVTGRPGTLQELLHSNLLMILRIIDSEPSRISVCAIPNRGFQPDVVNLHLNFNNGSAASLTLSFNGKKKEHLLSVHDSSGVMNYNFDEDEHLTSSLMPGSDITPNPVNNLLLRQISYFSDCILKKGCQRFGLNDEAKTFRLIGKINQKLELGSSVIV